MSHLSTKPRTAVCATDNHLLSLRLLRLPEVKARTGYSSSELYRRIAAGDFPAPVKLGERASAWPEHEVNAWCQARIAARDAKAGV